MLIAEVFFFFRNADSRAFRIYEAERTHDQLEDPVSVKPYYAIDEIYAAVTRGRIGNDTPPGPPTIHNHAQSPALYRQIVRT